MNITTNINNIISKINEHTNRLNTHISVPTSYHILQGNLAVDNYVTTQGFNTTLYTGNGSTQSINTGIDMDTQWGDSADEKYGGLIWLKGRSAATNNFLFDTIRGIEKEINTNTTEAEATLSSSLTAFTSTGMTLGSAAGINVSAATYASWNFQTTHRISGTTNHGKAYTCHYNPFTGFTIVKYEGSGIAGHEIPHHLGRKLGFVVVKNLSTALGWIAGINTLKGAGYLQLNLTDAFTAEIDSIGNWFPPSLNTETTICSGANNNFDNTSTSQYILYGWANSYYDENKLIGNYEIGVYQGTGASGNKVTTRGKPAWVMIKRLDAVSDWRIVDNQRGNNSLEANTSDVEGLNYYPTFVVDGFTVSGSDSLGLNTSGGQYLYMVAYDTNSNGGGSFYEKPTDNAQVQINNALIPLAKGYDSNGVKNELVVANETITGITLTAGKNYIYKTDSGYGVSTTAPAYGKDNPLLGDFYNVLTNKWYDSTDTEITESRNYLNHIVYADSTGNPLYIEELPKTEYKDSVNINRLAISETTWNNPDGIPYADSGIRGVPDTSFSPTGARIYPDGTIRGKSSYGEYVKYPDGRLEFFNNTSATVTISGSLFAFPLQYFPTNFIETPVISYTGIRETGEANATTNFIYSDYLDALSTSTYRPVGQHKDSTASIAGTQTVSVYAIGKWK